MNNKSYQLNQNSGEQPQTIHPPDQLLIYSKHFFKKQKQMENKNSLTEKYGELGQSSLIKVQYSCSGFGTSIDESSEYVPIVPDDVRTISRMEYAEAGLDDVEAIVGLLKANQLPTSDLSSGKRVFYVARSEKEWVGCVALELYGEFGLLRSLAVTEALRGRGVGKQLVEKAHTEARTMGLKQLFALTTTADAFFVSNNWTLTDRSTVPAAVAQSSEFSSVCPVSAVCLSYSLG